MISLVFMEVLDIPACFSPVTERETRRGVSYFNLSDHSFSAHEKRFLAEEVVGMHSLLQATNTFRGGGDVTAFGFSERYQIPRRTVRDWVSKFSIDNPHFQEYSGRPPDLDSEALIKMEGQLVDRRSARNPVLNSEFNTLLCDLKMETSERKGKRVSDVTVSTRAEKRIKKEHQLTFRKTRAITNARIVVARDIRAVYKQAAMLMAFSANMSAEYKFNFDATTFECKPTGAGDMAICKYTKEDKDEVVSENESGDLSVFVKWMFLNNAAGEVSPLVLIVAVKEMPPDVFYCAEVTGMSHELGIGSAGFLYCCRSRAGNAALWNHWYLNVVVPTIKIVRTVHNHMVRNHILLLFIFISYINSFNIANKIRMIWESHRVCFYLPTAKRSSSRRRSQKS